MGKLSIYFNWAMASIANCQLCNSHYQRLNPIKSHEQPQFSYGLTTFPMVFLYPSYGFPMFFLYFSYGFSLLFLCVSYTFPMVFLHCFLWFSFGYPYGFPTSAPHLAPVWRGSHASRASSQTGDWGALRSEALPWPRGWSHGDCGKTIGKPWANHRKVGTP